MTTEDWENLEELCRKALEEYPFMVDGHPITEAVKLTGAFAASVQEHAKEEANAPA